VLIEDHVALRSGIQLMLSSQGFQVVAAVASIQEACEAYDEHRPDVALVDLDLGGTSGLRAIECILEIDPEAGVLVYTGTIDRAAVTAAAERGARGFALKTGDVNELVCAIRVVAGGGVYVDPAAAPILAGPEAGWVLTARQRAVFGLLAVGMTGAQVAKELYLSPETVRTHIRNAMQRLGAATRVHAVTLAVSTGEVVVAAPDRSDASPAAAREPDRDFAALPAQPTTTPPDDAHWLGHLHRALALDRFELFAQPIFEIATGRLAQHELLLRMMGDREALIKPNDFLPTAERFGLIAEIDRWVVVRAAQYAAQGHRVNVNVAAGALADPDFGAHVERELAAAGAEPWMIGFEVTETALVTNEGLAAMFIERVRSLGCSVALDDFGAGYAGFHYYKRFRVDCLKIDREYIKDLAFDAASEHVVKAVVQLADGFGLQTVAEGVEDAATLERVGALGVSHAQGFHLGRPRSALSALHRHDRVAVM